MPDVPRLLFQILCAIAALSLSGVHYGVAQVWAWSTMLAERSADGDFGSALESTFDGDHPCALCLQVRNQTQKDDEQPLQKALKEFKPLVGGLCEAPPVVRGPDRTLRLLLPELALSPIEGFGSLVLVPPEHHSLV